MKRAWIFVLIAGFIIASIGMVVAADKSKVYYVCNCKDDCHCDSISKEPGKCKCGTEMVANAHSGDREGHGEILPLRG